MSKSITQIYDKYFVPENLRKHMFYVAGVASQILDSWTGPSVDRNALLRVLLLHDIGNIVKIDIGPEFTDPKVNPQDLMKYKEELIRQYGKDDHVVSIELSKQIGLSEAEIALMGGKIFNKNDETLLYSDYARKIGAYSDQRVAPDGVRPLLDRLLEAKQRYKDKPGSSMNNPKTDYLIECAIKIEEQVMKYCLIPVFQINNVNITPYLKKLERFSI